MDIFVEENSILTYENEIKQKKRFNLTFSLMIAFFSVAFIWLLVFVFYSISESMAKGLTTTVIVSWLIFYALPIVICVCLGIFFLKRVNKSMREYDYYFSNGTLTINVVLNRKHNKNVLEIDAHKINKIGLYNSNEYLKIVSYENTQVNFISANETASEGKNLFYLLFNERDERKVYIIESASKFIATISLYLGEHVIDNKETKNVIFR